MWQKLQRFDRNTRAHITEETAKRQAKERRFGASVGYKEEQRQEVLDPPRARALYYNNISALCIKNLHSSKQVWAPAAATGLLMV